jgi:hypothetical protein
LEVSYFSHYRKEKSYIDDCELRVKSFGGDELKKTNQESRQQRLEYFLEILRKIILKHEYPAEQSQTKKIRYLFKLMDRSKALIFLRDMIYENCKTNMGASLSENQFYELLDEYIKDIEKVSGKFYETSFSINIQKRIARDIWLHLLSHKSEKNWIFLFNHSYSFVMSRINRLRSERELYEWQEFLYRSMDKLLEANKIRGMEVIAKLSKYPIGPPFASEVHDLLGKMASEITQEMLGCLLRLPYFEYLKETILQNEKA